MLITLGLLVVLFQHIVRDCTVTGVSIGSELTHVEVAGAVSRLADQLWVGIGPIPSGAVIYLTPYRSSESVCDVCRGAANRARPT